MSMFPGPGAVVYYNEAGEPLGWDYPGSYEPDPYNDRDDSEGDRDGEMAEDAIRDDNDECKVCERPVDEHSYKSLIKCANELSER